eukprot:7009875-Pyramimonas_sp.AAC.1
MTVKTAPFFYVAHLFLLPDIRARCMLDTSRGRTTSCCASPSPSPLPAGGVSIANSSSRGGSAR